MNKITKILLIVIGIIGLVYAQADTTVKQDSLKAVLKEKSVAKITPKVPTNWSKVKDLFL
jgi:hypothetical protein